ncbi:phage major head protein (major coat protein) [Escherichia coli]|nr:phage major head protein (major coat protein) [Escherichia coli]
MSMYTTAQLLAANEQKFKFDPLFLRLFFRESYPFTTEKVYLSQIPGLVNMALYVSPIVSVRLSVPVAAPPLNLRRDMSSRSMR